jgi:hypothetical protein
MKSCSFSASVSSWSGRVPSESNEQYAAMFSSTESVVATGGREEAREASEFAVAAGWVLARPNGRRQRRG